jgi:hypothetical protein
MSDDQQIDALRDDIEQTRDEMSRTVDQLQERLAPDRLQRDTGAIVQEIADRVVAEIQSRTGDLTTDLSAQIQSAVHGATTAKSEELITQAMASARSAGSSVWSRLLDNPAPLALGALAVGLVAAGGRADAQQPGESDGEPNSRLIGAIDEGLAQANSAVDNASGAASAVTARMSDVVDRAKGALPAGPNGDGGPMHSMIVGQPVVAGVVALGLGLAIGLALPATQAERETAASLRAGAQERLDAMGLPSDTTTMVGRTKDRLDTLTTQAKETASAGMTQARQSAVELMEDVKQTASTAASERGLTR